VNDSILLSSTLKLNMFLTMSQVTRKLRLFFLPYLTIPPSVWFAMPKLMKMNSQDFKSRIERRGKTEHLDYFETLVPFDKPVPEDRNEIYHLENVAGQLLLASWQPLANQFYSLIFFLLKEPGTYVNLVEEVLAAFADSQAISMDTVGSLRYLHACVAEGLRLHLDTVDGLPRVSPGAYVDGRSIPRGVRSFSAPEVCFFADPLRFRPERWLPRDDPRWNPMYKDDDLKATKPFSQGLRGCPGDAIAVTVIRLFIAKVVWEFDLENVEGQRCLDFDKDFRFLTFWERPQYWVRFKQRKGQNSVMA
jgi:cytochrome P450